jgi:hypothetical protein
MLLNHGDRFELVDLYKRLFRKLPDVTPECHPPGPVDHAVSANMNRLGPARHEWTGIPPGGQSTWTGSQQA